MKQSASRITRTKCNGNKLVVFLATETSQVHAPEESEHRNPICERRRGNGTRPQTETGKTE